MKGSCILKYINRCIKSVEVIFSASNYRDTHNQAFRASLSDFNIVKFGGLSVHVDCPSGKTAV
jgi:hypothetical protein